MRQTSRDYAMQRVNEIENSKLATLKEACTVGGYEASPEEVMKALLDGKLPRSKKSCISGVTRYTDVVELWDVYALDRAATFDKKRYDKECVKIVSEATEVRDAIMLGYFDAALVLLAKFKAD